MPLLAGVGACFFSKTTTTPLTSTRRFHPQGAVVTPVHARQAAPFLEGGGKASRQGALVAICRGSPDCDWGGLGIALRVNEARSLRSNGLEALRLVADYQPAVVLLDLWLPGLPGDSVLEAVRREAPTVPIIIVSGDRDADRARALLLRGAFDYVP